MSATLGRRRTFLFLGLASRPILPSSHVPASSAAAVARRCTGTVLTQDQCNRISYSLMCRCEQHVQARCNLVLRQIGIHRFFFMVVLTLSYAFFSRAGLTCISLRGKQFANVTRALAVATGLRTASRPEEPMLLDTVVLITLHSSFTTKDPPTQQEVQSRP